MTGNVILNTLYTQGIIDRTLTANKVAITNAQKQIISNTSITTNGMVYGSASVGITSSAAASNAEFLQGNTGSTPFLGTIVNGSNGVQVGWNNSTGFTIDISSSANMTIDLLTLTGLTADRVVVTNGSKTLQSNAALTDHGFMYATGTGTMASSSAPSNGELLIGSTGGDPVKANITGTANQVTVTNGAGTITLSLPQNIHTAATPTFANITLSGTGSGNGAFIGGDFQIYRSAANVGTIPDSLHVTPPTSTITSGTIYGVYASLTGTPASSSSARYFGMSFDAYVTGAQNFTDATGGLTGFQAAIHPNGSGTITAASCAIFSGDTSSTQTITTLNQVYILGLDISTGATITTFNGLRVDGPRSSAPGGTVTTANWIKLQPRTFSAGTMTTAVGIDIFSAGNLHAHTANGQVRLGIDIGAMPSPGAFTGTTTAAIRIQGTGGSRDAILFSDVRLYRNTTTTLYCDQKFECVSLKVGTSSTVGQALTASDTAGNVAFTSIVNKHFVSVALCSAYSPAGTGADTAEFTVPYSPRDGTTSLTYNVRRIDFRVNVAGGAPAVTLEKYTGTGAFSATTIGTVTLGSGAYEGNKTSSFTTSTLTSGDKVRFNVGTLGTATGWTIQLLLEAT